MKHCVSLASEAFKSLVNESKMHPIMLAAKMGVWMDKNNTDEWPTLDQLKESDAIDKTFAEQISQYEKDNEMYQTKLRFDNRPSIPMSESNANTELKELSIVFPEESLSLVSYETLKTLDGETAYKVNINLDKPIKPIKQKIELSKEIELTPEQISEQALIDQEKENELDELKKAPFTDEEKTNMVIDNLTSLNNAIQTEIDFSPKLKVSQFSISNPMSSSTINVVTEIANKFNTRFGIKFEIVPSEEAVRLYNEGSTNSKLVKNKNGLLGFYDTNENKSYLVSGKLSAKTTMHEMFGHPFLNMLKNNPDLVHIYNQLALEATSHTKELNEIVESYEGYSAPEKLDELINTILEDKYINKLKELNNIPSSEGKSKSRFSKLLDAISNYLKQFSKFINKLFGKSNPVEEIRPDTTLDNLADYLVYGEGKLNLMGGEQAIRTESEISNLLDHINAKRFEEFKQRKITLNEAVKFNNDLTQELFNQNVVDTGVYDIDFIRKNLLSKLTYVDFEKKSIEYASGNKMATFESYNLGNSLLISDISIKDNTKNIDTPFILRSIVESLDKSDSNEILLKVNPDSNLYSDILSAFKEDSLYTKTIDGESYVAISKNSETITNMASLGRKSKLRAAAITVPSATSKEPSLPTQLEISASNAETLMHNIKVGLNTNLKILERNKATDSHTFNNMKNLINSIEHNDAATNAISFIKFAELDVAKTSLKLLEISNAMKNNEDIASADVMFINRDFLPLYKSVMDSIRTIYESNDFGIFNSLPKHSIDSLIHQVSGINKTIDEMARTVKSVINYNATKMFASIADEAKSPTMKEVLKRGNEVDSDLSSMGVFFGSLQNKKSEHLRALDKMIVDVQTNITRIVATDGTLNDLANSFTNLKKKNPIATYNEFMEHVNGKATGYITSDLLRGKFNKDISEFRKTLAKQYGLTNEYSVPSDPSDFKSYTEAFDKWKSDHAERMFLPEYYNAKKTLSSEASEALNDAKQNMASFGLAFKNEDGIVDTRLMTPSDLNAYHELRIIKNNLSSMVNLNGDEKLKGSLERNIADEISGFYKNINKGINYQTRIDLFNETYKNVIKDMSPEDANTWWKNNTKISFTQDWWDRLTSIEKNPQLPAYDDLYERRKAILNIYRNPDTMEVPAQRLESIRTSNGETLADLVKKIDLALNSARIKYGQKPGLQFKDIAEITPTDEYRKALRAAVQEASTVNPKAVAEFDERTAYTDGNGYRQLYSHWTKLSPKDKNDIFDEPNSLWSEMSPDSEYMNKGFNADSSEEGMIPKRELYDNSHAYNLIQNSPAKKDFHDKLIAGYAKANANYDYIQRPSKYRLAQIPGKFFERMTKGDRFMSGFASSMKDKIKWKAYDNMEGDYDTKGDYRIDGSKVRFVPTKYRTMLDDRDSISRDVLGAFAEYYKAAVNFKEMSKHSSDIDLLLESIKNLSVKDTSKKEIKGPGQSNIYNRASNFVSNTVYGDQMANQYNLKILGNTRAISMAKPVRDFINYVRKLMLSGNVFSIVGNFSASAINLKTEAICGIWLNNGGLLKGMKELTMALPSLVVKDNVSFSNNKLISFMRALDVTKSQHRDMQNLQGASLMKNMLSSFHYGPYTAGDLVVKGPMMVGVLSNFRPFEGKFYSREEFIAERFPGKRSEGELVFDSIDGNLYDAFSVVDGNLKINPKYASVLNEKTWNYAANIIHDLGSKLDGTLTQADKGKLHADAFASALFLNRGWMQVALEQRFATKKYNYRKQLMTSGTLMTPGTSAKILMSYLAEKLTELSKFQLTHLGKMTTVQDKYDANEIYNFRKTLGDISMLILVAAATLFAKSFVGDSDDDKKRSLAQLIYTLLMRTEMELGSSMSPADAFGLIQSPTTAQGPITELKEISDGFFDGTLFDDVQGGRYMYYKKWQKSLIKLTPGYKNYFENFVKPDLKAREYFMSKNMIGIYNITQGAANLLSGKHDNSELVKELERQKFENKDVIDNGENSYKPLFYHETKKDKQQQRINARKKAHKSKIINRKIKMLKK